MSMTRAQFGAFFAELHDGHAPFAWQWRLLDAVLEEGRWPDAIVAPTGAGKTAAIDIHVFALALAAATGASLPPRRLAMIVDRRVLVDDQHRYARAVARRLAQPDGSEILVRVADLLWQVQGAPTEGRSPLLVARLRGGSPPSRRWADHPTAAAVVCATPDMWGSRLLFRGYGSSPRSWPREAGLLAADTVAIVDEAHLAQQLLRTARRVGELVPVAERKWDGPSPLQVVQTTATPTGDAVRQLGVDAADLAADPALQRRLSRPKPVTLVPRKDWATTRPRPTVVDELARRTVDLLDRSGRTVGCFVNTVARAVAVTAALRDTRITGRELAVVMLCGQVRPIDVELLESRYPGLLTTAGNPEVDVLVSTQTLEVGVDLDLGGMVTELASGSALAQRAGRVNRLGLRPEGRVVVFVPDGPIRADARSGPYDAVDLNSAVEWLGGRAADPQGLAPWAVVREPAPGARLRRKLLQRPELGQAWHWARTSDDLAADPDLDLWLSDDLEPESPVGIVVRGGLPVDVGEAIELVKRLMPRRHEAFSVPLRTAREALAEALAAARKPDPKARLGAVLVRGDDVRPLDWAERDGEFAPRIRPGDVVVVDTGTALFTGSSTGDHRTPPVIVPRGEDSRRHPAEDVLESIAQREGSPGPGEVVHRIELADAPHLGDALAEIDEESATRAAEERELVLDWLDAHGDGVMARAAAELLRSATRQVDLVVLRDSASLPARVLVIDGRRAIADEYVRQEWTPSDHPVRLDDHQVAVAERVTELGVRLGLGDELATAMREAALHHDDGKADPRFQVRLGARGSTALAKSHGLVTPETVRRRSDRSGLPPRWRHEQRSVVDAWSLIPADVDRDLVARLIGTTHGHGRSWFPHTSAELLGDTGDPAARDIAAMLFDEGGWDELIERTEHRYGVWACAYLEAVLRAADGQVSAEKQ